MTPLRSVCVLIVVIGVLPSLGALAALAHSIAF